ncbi:hypothetical protein EJ110_NYTH41532 [Nymphaea thermarum]|nr:hypothetical protein EJ110_NYTH41532 [Nymphaea thermarum]
MVELVYYIWHSLNMPQSNQPYHLNTIHAVVNLGDFLDAETCLKEWEADLPNIREIANAEAVCQQAVSQGAVQKHKDM